MSPLPDDTLKQMTRQLEPRAVLEYLSYRPETIQENDKVIRCFCPVHKEQVFRTLSIDKKNRQAKCSYNPCPAHKQVDMVNLVALAMNVSVEEAALEIAQHFQLDVQLPGAEEILEKRVALARDLLAKEDYEKAADALAQVLALQPGNTEALQEMARVCVKLGRREESADIHKRLAQHFMNEKRLDKAAEVYRDYIVDNPEDIETRLRYAECLHQQGLDEEMIAEMIHIARVFEQRDQVDKALSIYRQVANLRPGDEDIQSTIVQLLVKAGRVEEAVNEMCARAKALREEDKLPEAIACYQQVLDLDPQRDDIRVEYIQTVLSGPDVDEQTLSHCLEEIGGLVQEGSSELALQCLEDLRTRFPDNTPVLEKIYEFYRAEKRDREADGLAFDLAQSYLDAGNYQMALDWIEPLVRRSSESLPIALSLKANICREMGEPDEALQTLHKIIKYHENAGEAEAALSYYETIFEIAPKDLDAHERYLQSLAQQNHPEELAEEIERLVPILTQSDDPRRALKAFETVAQVSTLSADMLLEQAAIYDKAGLESQARDARLRAVDLFLKEERTEEALKTIESLLAIDPHDLSVIERRADLQMQLGRRDEALECYRSLADLHREQGARDAELDVLLKISEMAPGNMDVLQQILALYDNLENKRDARELRASMARLYLGQDDYVKALEICERILSDEPGDTAALEIMLEVYRKQENDDEFRSRALQLIEAYGQRQETDAAAQLLEELAERFPDDTEVLARRALAQCEAHNDDEALPLIEQLLDLNARQGLAARSVKFLRQVISKSDRLTEALFPRWVELCFETGAFQELWPETVAVIDQMAVKEPVAPLLSTIEGVIDRLPGFEPLRARYVEILQNYGLTNRAMAAELDWARTCDKLGDHPSAARHYQQALELDPENVALQMEFLLFRTRTGQRDGTAELAAGLADLFESHGLVLQAIEVLDMGLRQEPHRGDLRRRVLALEDMAADSEALRNIYRESAEDRVDEGQAEWARDILIEACARFPADMEIRARLVEILLDLDRREEAIAELGAMATIHTEMGRLPEALETLDRILEIDPDNLRVQGLQNEVHARISEGEISLKDSERLGAAGAALVTSPGRMAQELEMLPLLEEYSFENFVVGTRNNFAYATAKAIANRPGADYNPVFIHGDVGLGKTHLIQAIANELIAAHPDMRILYTSSEEFTNALVEAIQGDTIKRFRALHKSLDVLLIDDVHALAEKERAQEEFFQIFNSLYQANRQIVLTSDRPPREITHLEKRLHSRFSAGIIVDVQPPDLETRMAILRTGAQEAGAEIDDDLLGLIAQRIETNVRELKGVLNQLLARMQLGQESPSEEMVVQILDQIAG